nr:purine permease [Tanacetum cinerariifolium]
MNALKARQLPNTLPATIPCFEENSGQTFSGKEVKYNCFKGAHVTEVADECGGKNLPLTDSTLKDLDTEDSCIRVGVLELVNSQDSMNQTWAGDQMRKVTDLEANIKQFKINQDAINLNAVEQRALLQERIEKTKDEADQQFAKIMNALKARQSRTTLPATISRFEENRGQTFSGKEVKDNCFKGAHVTEVADECGGKKLPLTDSILKDLDTEDSCTRVRVLESANSHDSTNPSWTGDQSRIRKKDVPSHGPRKRKRHWVDRFLGWNLLLGFIVIQGGQKIE